MYDPTRKLSAVEVGLACVLLTPTSQCPGPWRAVGNFHPWWVKEWLQPVFLSAHPHLFMFHYLSTFYLLRPMELLPFLTPLTLYNSDRLLSSSVGVFGFWGHCANLPVLLYSPWGSGLWFALIAFAGLLPQSTLLPRYTSMSVAFNSALIIAPGVDRKLSSP